MPEISPASSLLDVTSSMKVESKRERNGSDLINEHLVSTTASSDSGVWHLKRYCTNVTNNTLTWLRQWRPTNKAKRATADNQLSVVGHSLLQQAEDVSIQLQQRLAPPPPPSLKLKGKTGWFLGAGILAGATAGTLSFRYYSTPNAKAANDFAGEVPEPLALRGGATAIENMGYFEHIPPALQSANLISESYINHDEKSHSVSDSKHEVRIGLIRFLKRKKLLDRNVVNNEVKKEILIAAAAEYLYRDDVKTLASKEMNVAKHILAETDLYGGRKGESISPEFSQAVISNWIFNQVLGMSPGEYVANKIRSSDYPSYFMVSSLKYILGLNQIFSDGLLNYQYFSVDRWGGFNRIWHFYLEKEFPILKFSEKDIKNISLGSQDFADLYAGAALLDKTSDLKQFTLNETLKIGSALWEMVANEGVSLDNIGHFLGPSLISLVSNRKTRLETNGYSFSTQVAAVDSYIQYRKEVMAVQQEIVKQFERYTSAVNAWLSKGKLADKIISDCPKSEILAFTDIADGIRPRHQMHGVKINRAKQNYLNDFSKPCKNAPEKLDDEYKKLTNEVANSFQSLDENIIFSSFGVIDETEANFIFSSGAKIKPVQFSMHTNRPVGCVNGICQLTDYSVGLKNSDLFSVSKNNQERIYALKKNVNNSIFFYQLIRVDRDIKKYIDNGILDNDFTEAYAVEKDQVIDGDTFHFSITTLRPSIGHSNKGIHPVIDYLSKKHRDDLYHRLYASGDDKSELQKVWGFVKHVIPFYDCIEGIVNNDAIQAVPACMMDLIALIPVAGQAANMAEKFGMGLVKGLGYGSRTLMRGTVGDAGTAMLREIRLPQVNEFLGLSKNALRAVDPGFELLSKGGKLLGRKLDAFLRTKQSSIPLAEKISSFRTAESLPLTTKTYMTARLPHSEFKVPIQNVGSDSHGEYYSLVNPDTGEIFGRHYHLLENGRLKPAETTIQKPLGVTDVVDSNVAKNKMGQDVFPVQDDVEPMEIDVQPRNIHAQPMDIEEIDMDWSPIEPLGLAHIPLLDEFLPLPAFPPRQPHEVPSAEQYLEMSIEEAKKNYNQDVFVFNFNQDISDIPLEYQQLRRYLPRYKEEVLLTKEYAKELSEKLRRAGLKDHHGKLIYPESEGEISAYLSDVLGLDEIEDENIVQIIKEGAIGRLVYHTEKIKNYLNNEIGNVRFVTCDTAKKHYDPKSSNLMGFMYPYDSDRRIFILVDSFHNAEILSTRLHLTVLHEASHLSGTLDFQIAPSTSLVGDASEFKESFHDGINQVNNEVIKIHEFFIDAYSKKIQKLAKSNDFTIDEDLMREMLKKDPILKANAFMENADFLARMIADLATGTPANIDTISRRRRKAESFHADMTVVLYRLALGMMKKNTLIDRV